MHSGNSLLDLLQLLEIWTAPDSFCRAVRACTALHYTRGGFSTAAPLSGWELGTIFVLRNIADVIGKAQLITALEALEGPQRLDHRVLARGFGVRFLPSSGSSDTPLPTHEDRCAFCGELRYLRSACLACGAAHCLKISSRLPHLSMSHGGNIMKLDTTQLENLRLHAIEAGITYINDCAQEPKIFEEFGGDMIFLFRNLVHSVGLNGQICNIQNDSDYKHDIERSLQAASCFAELLARWTTENTRMTSEIEMEEILNTVEALHTLAQLGIKDDDQLPQPKEIALMLTAYEHPIVHAIVCLDWRTVSSCQNAKDNTFADTQHDHEPRQ